MSSPVAVLRWGSLALVASLACWSALALLPHISLSQTSQPSSATLSAQSVDQPPPTDATLANAPRDPAAEQLSRDVAILTARQEELLHSFVSLRRSLARQQAVDTLEQRVADVVTEVIGQQRPESPAIPPEELVAQWTRQTEQNARLQQLVADLQAEVSRLSEVVSQSVVSNVATPRPVLTTKLYRPLRLRADALEPLVQTLLTPEIGLWATVSLPGDERDAILICDQPDVIAQIDLLIAELDQPLPGLEFEFSIQELDATTGRPLSLAEPLAREFFPSDGPSLLVPESVWQQLTPSSQSSTSDQSTTLRVLRMTPRLIR